MIGLSLYAAKVIAIWLVFCLVGLIISAVKDKVIENRKSKIKYDQIVERNHKTCFETALGFDFYAKKNDLVHWNTPSQGDKKYTYLNYKHKGRFCQHESI